MIDAGRYTSGRIAVANLSASIDSLELRRAEGATFDNLVALSNLLFVRGDVLGRIADHDRAELIATEAIALSPDAAQARSTSVRGSRRVSTASRKRTPLSIKRSRLAIQRHEIDARKGGAAAGDRAIRGRARCA